MINIFMRSATAVLLLFGLADAASYTATGKFIVGTEEGTHSSFTANFSDGDKRISWGSGDGAQSYLQLVEASGNALADGVEYDFGSLIHGNFPIQPPSLRFIKLEWTLDVPTTPSGEPFNRTWTFDLYNWETNNATDDNGDCPRNTNGVVVNPADGHPYLGDGTSESVCDDAHNFGAVDTGNFEQDYTWIDSNNIVYYFKFSGFYDQQGTLTHTFWSPEGGESTGNVKFSVTQQGANEGSIGDRVWLDTNNNGLQDAEETTGPTGFTVELWEVNASAPGGATLKQTTTTDANGLYNFVNVLKIRVDGNGLAIPIEYFIKFTGPTNLAGLFEFTEKNAGGALTPMADGTDSDADPTTGQTDVFSVDLSNDTNRTSDIDAGIKRGAIGNQVWVDTNKDGIQDLTEKGLADVVVNLYKDGGATLMQTVSTDILGKYLFAPLVTGRYVVEFVLPTDYTFSPKNAGGDTTKDSDADETTGRTDIISLSLSAGQNSALLDWDAGMIGAEPPEFIPPLGDVLPEADENCPCNDVKSDSSSTFGTVSAALMMLMTVMAGLFFVRRETQLNRYEK